MSVTSPSTERRIRRRRTPALLALAVLGVIVLAFLLLTQSASPVVTQTRSLPGFNAVELAGTNVVTVHVGARQSVSVRARRNMLDRVTTDVQAGTLVIGNVPGSPPTEGPMSVSVTVPSLTALTLPGNGIITVTGVNAPALTVAIPGSGMVQASGVATRLGVSVDGSGNADLGQLVARDATATVNGSGRIVVNATGSVDAAVPGAGLIQYLGNPQHLSTSVTGSGAVTPG